MTESTLTVAVIDPSQARAAILEEGLRMAGIGRVFVLPDSADLQERVSALKPDVVVIHLESPSRDILEQMSSVSRHAGRPVAMFVDRSDAAMMEAAVDAGISAYVVDGLRPSGSARSSTSPSCVSTPSRGWSGSCPRPGANSPTGS